MNSWALASLAASTIFVLGGVRTAEGDVVTHRAPQQHGVLQHEADLGAESREACNRSMSHTVDA